MITEYFRPSALAEAVALAARPDAVVIGGGTVASTDRSSSSTAAVDLQALGLAGIELADGELTIGSMTTLQTIVDSNAVPEVLAELARRDAPRSIRNAATLGGAIVSADAESELVAGFLAFGATVTVASDASTDAIPLDSLLADTSLVTDRILTEISIPVGGTTAAERTGRTPMDRPIVAAMAHRDALGVVRLGMSGVADRPVLVDPDRLDELQPPDDFRGASDYRAHLASVLAARALSAVSIGGGA